MHTGAIPVAGEGLAVPIYVYSVFFAEAKEQESCDPDIVSGFFRPLSEDLKFPLPLGDLGIDTFMVDACMQALPEMFLGNLPSKGRHVLEANSVVIFTLGFRIPFWRKADRNSVLSEEILLLKTEPSAFVVEDGSAGV
jgi:hypothetical protein